MQCVYELDNDPEVMRYINGGTPTPRRIIRGEILPIFMHWDEAFSLGGFWAAEEVATGAFVGWFSLRPIGATIDSVVLGYRLRRVMEKVGLRLVRRFRLSPDEIAEADTSHSESTEVWDGDDMECALERNDWELSTGP